VLIVQEDALTKSRLQTVMVVPATSNLKLATAPGNILLLKSRSKLAVESVALCCQVLTIDKAFLTNFVSALPDPAMARVNEALKLTLSVR
jgi:mRNA interferase MazF